MERGPEKILALFLIGFAMFSFALTELVTASSLADPSEVDNDCTHTPSLLPESAFVVQWSYQFEKICYRMVFAPSPAVADLGYGNENLEVVTGNDEWYPQPGISGRWFAFDAGGKVLWTLDTGNDESRTSVAIADLDHDGDLEMAGGTTSGWQVQVFNHLGEMVWTQDVGYFVHSSPAVADLRPDIEGLEVVAGSYDKNIYVFDASGRSIWVRWLGGMVISSPAVGDVDADGALEVVVATSSITWYDGREYKYSYDSKLYCLDGTTGEIEWTHDFNDDYGVASSAALANLDGDPALEVVVGSGDSKIYSFDGASGAVEWTFTTAGAVHSSPAVGDVDEDGDFEIVVGSSDGKVYCLNGATGTLRWVYETGGAVWSSAALVDRGKEGLEICIGSDDHHLYLIEGETGFPIDNFRASGPVRSSPTVADIDGDERLEVLFIDWNKSEGNRDWLWCLEDTGSQVAPYTIEWGMFRHNIQRTGFKGVPSTAPQTAEVNQSPTASFTYSPSAPTTDDSIKFTDTSVDPDGEIVSWKWEFGDRTDSTLQNPTHRYFNAGMYSVVLTVTDDNGATGVYSTDIWVVDPPPTSSVNPIIPYWQDPATLTLTATVTHAENVTLYYRRSADNVTFSPWSEIGTDVEAPWEWSLDLTENHYYEFYSVARNRTNNAEAAPMGLLASQSLDEKEKFKLKTTLSGIKLKVGAENGGEVMKGKLNFGENKVKWEDTPPFVVEASSNSITVQVVLTAGHIEVKYFPEADALCATSSPEPAETENTESEATEDSTTENETSEDTITDENGDTQTDSTMEENASSEVENTAENGGTQTDSTIEENVSSDGGESTTIENTDSENQTVFSDSSTWADSTTDETENSTENTTEDETSTATIDCDVWWYEVLHDQNDSFYFSPQGELTTLENVVGRKVMSDQEITICIRTAEGDLSAVVLRWWKHPENTGGITQMVKETSDGVYEWWKTIINPPGEFQEFYYRFYLIDDNGSEGYSIDPGQDPEVSFDEDDDIDTYGDHSTRDGGIGQMYDHPITPQNSPFGPETDYPEPFLDYDFMIIFEAPNPTGETDNTTATSTEDSISDDSTTSDTAVSDDTIEFTVEDDMVSDETEVTAGDEEEEAGTTETEDTTVETPTENDTFLGSNTENQTSEGAENVVQITAEENQPEETENWSQENLMTEENAAPEEIRVETAVQENSTSEDGMNPPIEPDQEPCETVVAVIDIDPDTLNLSSDGRWITCYIELPAGYDVAEIDLTSVVLNGVVQVEVNPAYGFVKNPDVKDRDGDGLPELMVKFDRSAVQALVWPGEVKLTVMGRVGTQSFAGSDVIRVLALAREVPEPIDATPPARELVSFEFPLTALNLLAIMSGISFSICANRGMRRRLRNSLGKSVSSN